MKDDGRGCAVAGLEVLTNAHGVPDGAKAGVDAVANRAWSGRAARFGEYCNALGGQSLLGESEQAFPFGVAFGVLGCRGLNIDGIMRLILLVGVGGLTLVECY